MRDSSTAGVPGGDLMNGTFDTPTNPPTTAAHPEQHASCQWRTLSDADLTRVLAQHQKWVESEKQDGEQANLRWVDLENADLSDAELTAADLCYAKLRGANLHRANLCGAYLSHVCGLGEAALHDINLEDATGLLGTEFARADVTGARLPGDIRAFKSLQVVEETSKNARKIFLSMLVGSVYTWLTIATTTDVHLLTNSASSPLPIIGTAIPIAWFYWAAPLALMGLYIYLHLYLHHLWEGLASLPAKFPDGKRVDERAYPWLLNGLVRRHFARLQAGRPPMAHLEEWVTILLAWWVVPLTLLGVWLRYLPSHDWVGTGLHIGLLVVSVALAILFYHVAARTLRGHAYQRFCWQTAWRDRRSYQALAVAGIGVALWALSYGAINGVWAASPYLEVRATVDVRDVRSWVPWAFAQLGYRTFADVVEHDVSTKPPNYWALSLDARTKSVKGALLRGRDLRRAHASQAFLSNADLRGADLRQAILIRTNLQGANLAGANLERVVAFGADLQAATLLGDTNLRKADLRGADLTAVRTGCAVSPSRQSGETTLRSACTSFEDAHLFGATLKDADLRGARHLTQGQLDGACGNPNTQLPQGLRVKMCQEQPK